MKILDLLIILSKQLPDEISLTKIIDVQPEDIRNALKSDCNEILRNCISDKQFYAQEIKVTIY